MFIDIHVHARGRPGLARGGRPAYATPAQLLQRYDALGVEQGCVLPGVSPECAWQAQSVEEVLDIAAGNPGRFVPFCNVDPRAMTHAPDAPLEEMVGFYRDRGCRGVGEVTANLALDDPLVFNLFRACRCAGLPVTFHLSTAIGGQYGLFDDPGLPRLEKALRAFPDLVFLGHSQPFWAEIAPLADAGKRGGYPAGAVRAGGRVVKLMRGYPNLHGDLSANSGFNALSRDEGFAGEFLQEFQDRLYFGTDICAPDTPAPLAEFLLRLRDQGTISPACFEKVARSNAARLLRLDSSAPGSRGAGGH